MVGLERDDPLPRPARLDDRAAATRPIVEEHLGQLIPRLDVLRLAPDDSAVQTLRFWRIAGEERAERLEQLAVVRRQSFAVRYRLLGRVARQLQLPRPERRHTQPVPGEREGGVFLHGALIGVRRRRPPHRPHLALAHQVILER